MHPPYGSYAAFVLFFVRGENPSWESGNHQAISWESIWALVRWMVEETIQGGAAGFRNHPQYHLLWGYGIERFLFFFCFFFGDLNFDWERQDRKVCFSENGDSRLDVLAKISFVGDGSKNHEKLNGMPLCYGDSFQISAALIGGIWSKSSWL